MVDETTNDLTPADPSSLPDDQATPPAKPATGLPAGSATPFTALAAPAAPKPSTNVPQGAGTKFGVPAPTGEPVQTEEEKQKASIQDTYNNMAADALDLSHGDVKAAKAFVASGNLPQEHKAAILNALDNPNSLPARSHLTLNKDTLHAAVAGPETLVGGTNKELEHPTPTTGGENIKASVLQNTIGGVAQLFSDKAAPDESGTSPLTRAIAKNTNKGAVDLKAVLPADNTPSNAFNRGLLGGASGLTSPENLALIASMEGAPAAASRLASSLKTVASTGFTLQMAHDIYKTAPEVKHAVDNGDFNKAAELLGRMVPEAVFTGEGLKNLYEGGVKPLTDPEFLNQARGAGAERRGQKLEDARAERQAGRVADAKKGNVIDVKPIVAESANAPAGEPAQLPPAPPHVTFDSIGGTEVKAPEPATRPSELAPNREVMIQDQRRAGGQGEQTADLPALHPEEHAELEAQAGRPLTTAEAANFRNNQLITQTNQRMAATGEGTRDEISNAREPHRAELEQEPVGVGSALESRTTIPHEIRPHGPLWERTQDIIVDGKKVGSVMVKTDPTGHAQIAGSQVDPDMRGQGLAQSAYRAAIAEAQANGATRITSDSTNVSPAANRVWEKLRDKGLPVENITHPNGKPGYQIDFENPAEPPASLESVAKQAGVAFRGVQQGVGDKAIAIFQDPVSKTSFTVDANNWSPEKFQQSLSAARERMQAAQHDPQFQEKLISRGQALGQKIDLSPAYGETGRGIGGFLEHALPGKTPEERRAQYIENLGNTQGTDLMSIPAYLTGEGGAEHRISAHELTHHVQQALENFPTDGAETLTRLHPESDPRAAGTARTMIHNIPGATLLANGQVSFSRERMAEIGSALVRTILAPAFIEQQAFGVPIKSNAGLYSDNKVAEGIFRSMGFSSEQISALIAAERENISNQWTPAMIDAVKTEAATREEGLSKTLMHSTAKVQDVIQKVKEAQNEGTQNDVVAPNRGRDVTVGGKTQPRGEGETAKTDLGGHDEKSVSPLAEARKVKTANESKPNPPVGFIRPDGQFEPFRRGELSHNEAAERMMPKVDAGFAENNKNPQGHEDHLLDIGWVRKAARGSYAVSKLSPQTTKAIELDIIHDFPELKQANKTAEPGSGNIVVSFGQNNEYEITPEDFIEKYNGDLTKALTANGYKVPPTAPVSYPKAGKTVDGLTVGDYVPNTESISASLPDWQEHSGIREVPIEDIGTGHVTKTPKIRALADKIKNSGRIAPLIVVIDKDGPYILEGSHRFDALHMLGKKSFPALVVDDAESLSQNGEKTTYPILDLESEEKSSLSPKLEYRIQPKHQEEFRDAVTNTPGAKINEDGSITLNLSRRQKPEQAGARAIRSGVFFLPETKSPFASYYTGPGSYGGSQQIAENEVTFKNPIVVKGATGGKVPERVYDYLHGKNAYADMRKDVLQSLGVFNLPSSLMSADEKEQQVGDLLANYGADSDFAHDIVAASKMGNQLPYAIQEHIVAQAIRNAGYDALIGYSKHKGQPRLSEVFDIGRESYPKPK